MGQDGLFCLLSVFHAKIHQVLLVQEVHYQLHRMLVLALSLVQIQPFAYLQLALMAFVMREHTFMALIIILEDAQFVRLDLVAQVDTFLIALTLATPTMSSSAEQAKRLQQMHRLAYGMVSLLVLLAHMAPLLLVSISHIASLVLCLLHVLAVLHYQLAAQLALAQIKQKLPV